MTDVNDWNKKVIAEFRANDGKVGGNFENMTLLLLHTTGAKSGLPRINPLVCIEDGERLVIAASKGGTPSNPDWYHNLVASTQVNVEYGADSYAAQANITAEPERTQLFNKLAAQYNIFNEYREKTDRIIPIITLTRQ